MIKPILSLFKKDNDLKIQSFTYFIPSPPSRSTGYREKQFDKIFYEFINKGYRILNFTTETSTGDKQSGMWVIIIVQALNKKAEELNLDELMLEGHMNKNKTTEAIDGLYYIDDRE